MKRTLYLFLLTLVGLPVFGQLAPFSPHQPKAAEAVDHAQRVFPTTATYLRLADPAGLATALAKAPNENQGGEERLQLTLPAPDGTPVTFRVVRYQMINPALQAAYPDFVTAWGYDVTDPSRRVMLDWTAKGFAASVIGGGEGRWYVSPRYEDRTDLYQVYLTRDVPAPADAAACAFVPNPDLQAEIEAFGPAKSVGDCQLREYDLALACTGEYYAAVGGTDATVLSEMMTAINRVNEVFRADLALTLVMINEPLPGGGVELLYDDPDTDPYDNGDGSAMLGQNQIAVDNVIGSANYDIGHVFSTGGGGVAILESPCDIDFKAQGVTGLPNPTGEPFYIDFVAHEMGHQFGGEHTFNSTESSCSAREATTAYEPGSGTTIQAYAGICGPVANVQPNSDPYYHAVSIQQIAAYMELGGGADCADVLSTGNAEPTAAAGPDYVIPTNTPFVLTATATDGNAADALTYCWEQFDLGPVVAGPPTGNETAAPLFRSLPPTNSPQRYFPNLTDLTAGAPTPWEALPLVARNMTFIVTVRDFGVAGYGCPVQDEMDIQVAATTGQYGVTQPNGGETYTTGSAGVVTWDVAGTNAAPISCANVDVMLSTDGGLTYAPLATNVPNSGTAAVTWPTTTTSSARIMVRCAGNIFFDISDADFALQDTEFTLEGVNSSASTCTGDETATFTFEVASTQGYVGSIALSETGLPAGATVTYSTNPVTFTAANVNTTETVTATVSNLSGAAAGTYVITVTGDDGVSTKTTDLTLEVGAGPLTLNLPEDMSQQLIGQDVTFEFLTVAGRNRYIVSYSLSRNGTTLGTGSFGTVFLGDPGDGQVVSSDETLFGNGAVDGDVITWFVTASDDNNLNGNVISCSRTYTLVNMILPVDWLSFTAAAAGKTAALDWSVAQDEQHAGFTVERTTAGRSGWQALGYVARRGADGVADYRFTDATVEGGTTYAYRIRQQDTDGSASYSDVRTVRFADAQGIAAWPNPTDGRLTLTAGGSTDEAFVLYGALGQVLRRGNFRAGRAELDLTDLAAGVYQIATGVGTPDRRVIRVVKR